MLLYIRYVDDVHTQWRPVNYALSSCVAAYQIHARSLNAFLPSEPSVISFWGMSDKQLRLNLRIFRSK